MKKRRDVKEGSPFEEENLLDLLKDDTVLKEGDKTEVRSLMQVLSYFGLITESNMLHELVARVIKAGLEADGLGSVEQERLVQRQPELKLVFERDLGRPQVAEKVAKELNEWEQHRWFKH